MNKDLRIDFKIKKKNKNNKEFRSNKPDQPPQSNEKKIEIEDKQ